MTRGRVDWVRVDWRGPGGNDSELELEEGLAALAGLLRSMPPQPVRNLIGVDLWMEPMAYAGAPATGQPILPYPETPFSWARIEALGDARIACAACGRPVALAEAWLASGRAVCSSCM